MCLESPLCSLLHLQAMFDIDSALVTQAKNRFNENTPLHLATEGGHLEAVKIM